MPKVSVIVPLYQTERYILEALHSIAAQTFRDFEVIVVDDGSTDGGPAIAALFDDARFRVVSQKNRGLAGARNTGIRESCGEYIALLDADDRWAPTKLQKLVARLDGDPLIGAVFATSLFIDADGKSIGLIQRPANRPFDAEHIYCRNPLGNGSNPVLRRAALEDVAFFDGTLDRKCWFDESFRQSEDIECWTRLAALGTWAFALVDEPLTLYRIAAGGLSANIERQLETWRRFRAKVKIYAPALDARVGDLAEAYQLRYLARRSIHSRDGRLALRLTLGALRFAPSILLREPGRTTVTLAAATANCLLPSALFGAIERAAIRSARKSPARA